MGDDEGDAVACCIRIHPPGWSSYNNVEGASVGGDVENMFDDGCGVFYSFYIVFVMVHLSPGTGSLVELQWE